MTTMQIISQIVNFFGSFSNMIGISLKDKRKILIFFTIGNALVATALGLLGATAGMIVQIAFVVETIINYFWEKKYPSEPIWLILIYIAIPLVILIVTFSTYWDILPMVASTLFALSMVSKNFYLRMLNLLSVVLWIPYNLLFAQYVGIASCGILAAINFIAIVRYDILKKKNPSQTEEIKEVQEAESYIQTTNKD